MVLRLKLVFLITLILLLSLSMMKSVPATGVVEPLTMAMEATGAQVEEVSINAWVKLPNSQLNDEELTEVVQQVMRELEVKPLDYQLTQQQTDKQHSVQAEAISPNYHVLAIIRMIPSGLIVPAMEYYLAITIEEKAMMNSSVNRIQEAIRVIGKEFGSSPHINTCLIGWLNGTLRDGEQQDLLQKAFKIIDGKIIDKLESEHLISYTGFTSGIIEGLRVNDEKINLNMAMRYSQYDNRTYVTIGSPIITREY